MCRSEFMKVLLAESPCHTPVQQDLHHLGHQHALLLNERGSLVQSRLEPCVACPRESGPSFDVWRNVGACVDKTAQVRKLNGVPATLACSFDDEW